MGDEMEDVETSRPSPAPFVTVPSPSDTTSIGVAPASHTPSAAEQVVKDWFQIRLDEGLESDDDCDGPGMERLNWDLEDEADWEQEDWRQLWEEDSTFPKQLGSLDPVTCKYRPPCLVLFDLLDISAKEKKELKEKELKKISQHFMDVQLRRNQVERDQRKRDDVERVQLKRIGEQARQDGGQWIVAEGQPKWDFLAVKETIDDPPPLKRVRLTSLGCCQSSVSAGDDGSRAPCEGVVSSVTVIDGVQVLLCSLCEEMLRCFS